MKKLLSILIFIATTTGLTSAQSGQYFLIEYCDEMPRLFVTILTLNRDSTSEHLVLHINEIDVEVEDCCLGYWKTNHNCVEVMSEEYLNADASTRQFYRALCSMGEDVCFLYRSFICCNHKALSSPLYDGNFHPLNCTRMKAKDKRILKKFLATRLYEKKPLN